MLSSLVLQCKNRKENSQGLGCFKMHISLPSERININLEKCCLYK